MTTFKDVVASATTSAAENIGNRKGDHTNPITTSAIPSNAAQGTKFATADDVESHKASLYLELRSLEKKEKELFEALDNVNDSLLELGIPSSLLTDEFHGPASKTTGQVHDPIKSSGIRMKNQLSFRGEDKSKEYFRLLDINKDNHIGFEEMRSIDAFRYPFGFIEDPAFQSS
jgi:hypothetical protein